MSKYEKACPIRGDAGRAIRGILDHNPDIRRSHEGYHQERG